jgi:hypothetical protein
MVGKKFCKPYKQRDCEEVIESGFNYFFLLYENDKKKRVGVAKVPM